MQVKREQVEQWIALHKDELVAELMEWTAHPSVSRADLADEAAKAPYGPDCRKMLDFALQRGQELGFRVEDHDGYCGSMYYGEAAEEIGFVAHLDVVPEGEGWIFSPYQPVIKDGFIIGRGCGDNKCAAIIGLAILKFLKENDLHPSKTFRLMMGCAEETGMDDFTAYFSRGGHAPELSIVCDAGFPVCYAQKGGWDADIVIPAGKNIIGMDAGNVRNSIPDKAVITLTGIALEEVKAVLAGKVGFDLSEDEGTVTIIAHGRGGHAASPDGTENAIVKLASALAESDLFGKYDLKGLDFIAKTFYSPYGDGMGFAFEDEMSGKLTSNIGAVHYKDGVLNTLLDVRYSVTADIQTMTEAWKEYLAENGVEMPYLSIVKPFYMDPQDPRIRMLQKTYFDLTGDAKEAYTMGGGTYSRVIPNAITFGPGLPAPKPEFLPEGHGGGHAPDEVRHIETWLKAMAIEMLSVLQLLD